MLRHTLYRSTYDQSAVMAVPDLVAALIAKHVRPRPSQSSRSTKSTSSFVQLRVYSTSVISPLDPTPLDRDACFDRRACLAIDLIDLFDHSTLAWQYSMQQLLATLRSKILNRTLCRSHCSVRPIGLLNACYNLFLLFADRQMARHPALDLDPGSIFLLFQHLQSVFRH